MKIIDIIERFFFGDIKKDIVKHLDESFAKIRQENKEACDSKLKEFKRYLEKSNEKSYKDNYIKDYKE